MTQSFSNPVPVAVCLVPYQGKLIGIRRGIEPYKGKIAFPGGYINSGETFCEALSRELKEETGIELKPEVWTIFKIGDAIGVNRILLFGLASPLDSNLLVNFSFKSSETEDVLLIDDSTPLAFPLHEEVKKQFFI